MRLYPRKLHSVDELKRERKRLLEQSRDLDNEEFLSLDGLLGKGKNATGEKSGGAFFGLFDFSNPLVTLVAEKLIQRFTGPRERHQPAPPSGYTYERKEKPGKSIPYKIAAEFIGGYLKWKAVELSYKGIRYLLRSRKEKSKNK